MSEISCTFVLLLTTTLKPQQSWTERDKRFGGRVFYKRGKDPLAIWKIKN